MMMPESKWDYITPIMLHNIKISARAEAVAKGTEWSYTARNYKMVALCCFPWNRGHISVDR